MWIMVKEADLSNAESAKDSDGCTEQDVHLEISSISDYEKDPRRTEDESADV